MRWEQTVWWWWLRVIAPPPHITTSNQCKPLVLVSEQKWKPLSESGEGARNFIQEFKFYRIREVQRMLEDHMTSILLGTEYPETRVFRK